MSVDFFSKKDNTKIERKNRIVDERVAKLLATEDITVIFRKVSTASFDVRHRILTMPIWKNASREVRSLLIAHEVGHALFTPNTHKITTVLNILEDARVEKLIKRRFPGVRVDFCTGYKEMYDMDFFGTGGRKLSSFSFIDRINLHFKLGLMGIVVVPFTDSEKVIVEKIAKAETFEEILTIKKEIEKLIREEQKKREEAKKEQEKKEQKKEKEESDETGQESPEKESEPNDPSENEEGSGEVEEETEDDEINEEVAPEAPEEDEKDDTPSDCEEGGSPLIDEEDEEETKEEESTDSESTEADEEVEESEDEAATDGKGEVETDEAGNEEADGSDEKSSSHDTGEGSDVDDESDEEMEIESETEDSLDDGIETFTGEGETDNSIKVLTVPTLALENVVVPFKKMRATMENYGTRIQEELTGSWKNEDLIKHMKTTADAVRGAVPIIKREFDMRKEAEAHRGATSSDTGRINMKKIFKYKISDDIFKRVVKISTDETNHRLVMYVDFSGSMWANNKIVRTITHLNILVEFCRAAGIPYDVFGYTTSTSNRLSKIEEPKEGNIVPSNEFALYHIFHSNMGKSEHKEAVLASHLIANRNTARYVGVSLMSTPLYECMIHAIGVLDNSYITEKTTVIFLHDGDGDNIHEAIGEEGRMSSFGYYANRSETDEILIIDPKDKEYMSLSKDKSPNGCGLQEVLVSMLKKRCHEVIGFWIGECGGGKGYKGLDGVVDRVYRNLTGKGPAPAELKESVRKNNIGMVDDNVHAFGKYAIISFPAEKVVRRPRYRRYGSPAPVVVEKVGFENKAAIGREFAKDATDRRIDKLMAREFSEAIS